MKPPCPCSEENAQNKSIRHLVDKSLKASRFRVNGIEQPLQVFCEITIVTQRTFEKPAELFSHQPPNPTFDLVLAPPLGVCG